MPEIGLLEIVVIGIVFVLLFGTKKIPEFAKGLGTGIRNFKESLKGETEDLKAHVEDVRKEIEKS